MAADNAKRPLSLNIKSEKCGVCNETVYPMDRIQPQEVVFHKSCFRCTHCNQVMSLGNFAAMNGQYFCKPHFKQLFQLKGNYDEGFGREQHKTKWLSKEDGGDSAESGGESGAPTPSMEDGSAISVTVSDAAEAPATPNTANSDGSGLSARKAKAVSIASPKINVSNAACVICSQTVYPMDKVSADEKVFHKSCFRCTTCKNVLSLGNYAALEGIYYCKPHFKQLFALKGNYDEGFGREQHKKQWQTEGEPEPASS